jgi:hypothetical protein
MKHPVSQGVLSGLLVSLGIALLLMPILVSTTFEFKISLWLLNIFDLLGFAILGLSALTVGVLPTLSSKTTEFDKAVRLSLVSGVTAGVVVFVLIGSVCTSLLLGVIPFLVYLTDPAKLLSVDPTNVVIRPVVQFVIIYSYLILLVHIAAGAVISVVESIPAALVMRTRIK